MLDFRCEDEEEKRQDVESKRQYLLNRSKEKRAKDAEMMAKIKYSHCSSLSRLSPPRRKDLDELIRLIFSKNFD